MSLDDDPFGEEMEQIDRAQTNTLRANIAGILSGALAGIVAGWFGFTETMAYGAGGELVSLGVSLFVGLLLGAIAFYLVSAVVALAVLNHYGGLLG